MTQTAVITADTKLVLSMEGETLETTWGSFVRDNDLNEEPEWRDAIAQDIQHSGCHSGGGGAQPWYRLSLASVCVALLGLALATGALAQQRTFYDSGGRVSGRAATDSQGSTTFYDSGGRVTGRSSPSSGGTTFYDSRGRSVGTVTAPSNTGRSR